jgi:hypothetical protein
MEYEMSYKQPIFRWSGEYFGFLYNGRLFDGNSNYLGWTEDDGSVWNKDGTYLGVLTNENYILRKTVKIEPVPKVPKVPPVPPVRPIPKINKIGKIGRIGWEDALERFSEDNA